MNSLNAQKSIIVCLMLMAIQCIPLKYYSVEINASEALIRCFEHQAINKITNQCSNA